MADHHPTPWRDQDQTSSPSTTLSKVDYAEDGSSKTASAKEDWSNLAVGGIMAVEKARSLHRRKDSDKLVMRADLSI